MELDAKDLGGNIIISKHSFKYLLECLRVQKDLGKMGNSHIFVDMQNKIDQFALECKGLLNPKCHVGQINLPDGFYDVTLGKYIGYEASNGTGKILSGDVPIRKAKSHRRNNK